MNSFNAFPTGRERKSVIRKNEAKIDHFKDTGRKRILDECHYSWVDSAIDDPNDGDGEPFHESFKDLLPYKSLTLKNYIETTIKERKGKAIGVEFGGIGTKLFSGFSSGFFAKSIAVSLVDHRPENKLQQSIVENEKINHQFMVGDIFSPDTYKSLNEILKGEKVDLIIERMAKGLEFIPIEPFAVSKILEIWYDMLRDGGIMFVQVPVSFNHLLKVWGEKLDKEFKDTIKIYYKKGSIHSGHHHATFSLRKLPGAPEKLPLLDPHTVHKTEKWSK